MTPERLRQWDRHAVIVVEAAEWEMWRQLAEARDHWRRFRELMGR